jgi:hypothetical protein
MKSKEPEITFSELMAAVSKYEFKCKLKATITDEQFEFIKKARNKNMPWPDITKLFGSVKGWGKRSKGFLQRNYKQRLGKIKK